MHAKAGLCLITKPDSMISCNQHGNQGGEFTHCAGLSLIEVVVALFIIALVFGGVYGMSSQSTNSLSLVRGETRAIEAAQYEIERLRSMSWASIMALGSSYSISESENESLAQVPSGSGSVTITPYPPTDTSATLRTISVEIRWEGASGHTNSTSLTTLIAEQGLAS